MSVAREIVGRGEHDAVLERVGEGDVTDGPLRDAVILQAMPKLRRPVRIRRLNGVVFGALAHAPLHLRNPESASDCLGKS